MRVHGAISGLSPGKHGFHVHQFGDVSGGCKSTGGHFNPQGVDHGSPLEYSRHVGDMGNIDADHSGVAAIDQQDGFISLVDPHRSVVGRGIVVHAGEDDLGKGGDEGSLKTGNAGGRVGCCVIGYKNVPATPKHAA